MEKILKKFLKKVRCEIGRKITISNWSVHHHRLSLRLWTKKRMENAAQTWKEFIQTHKDQEEYEKNAESIQKIIDPKDQPVTSFTHLMDHPTLVVLTKSPIEDEVQATFFHSKVKASLLSAEHDYLALSGSGKRACAMRIDMKEMFRTSSSKKKIPSFKELIDCADIEEILSLKLKKDGKKKN